MNGGCVGTTNEKQVVVHRFPNAEMTYGSRWMLAADRWVGGYDTKDDGMKALLRVLSTVAFALTAGTASGNLIDDQYGSGVGSFDRDPWTHYNGKLPLGATGIGGWFQEVQYSDPYYGWGSDAVWWGWTSATEANIGITADHGTVSLSIELTTEPGVCYRVSLLANASDYSGLTVDNGAQEAASFYILANTDKVMEHSIPFPGSWQVGEWQTFTGTFLAGADCTRLAIVMPQAFPTPDLGFNDVVVQRCSVPDITATGWLLAMSLVVVGGLKRSGGRELRG